MLLITNIPIGKDLTFAYAAVVLVKNNVHINLALIKYYLSHTYHSR